MTYASVNGQTVTKLRIMVGARGPWFALLDLDTDVELAGRVTIEVGGLELVGTVDPVEAGSFGGSRRVRVTAGGGGWGTLVTPKGYHNDAQIKALNVAQDAATAAGEKLGGFAPEKERVGIDYVREAGPAARVLEDVIGSASWWVDYAGLTQVGTRPTSTPSESAYEVIGYDPRSKVVSLRVDDLAAVGVGSVLTKTLDAPQTVRDLEVILDGDQLELRAWCGASAAQDRLAGLIRSLVERFTDGALHGVYRYRVIKMALDRIELQAVRKGAGLPDLIPVSAWPGLAGARVQPAPGAEVLVQFVEGDRTMPVVTGFAPDTSGAPIARQGDAVEVLLPPAVFSGTIGGSPASGVLTFVMNKALGVITAGSGKAKLS
jgi:hypothetical protein